MAVDPATYIVGECAEDEECLCVVPSARLGAQDFMLVLERNGISVRPLGQGTGTVLDASGSEYTVPGVVLMAIARADECRVAKHARMCAVAIARIEKI